MGCRRPAIAWWGDPTDHDVWYPLCADCIIASERDLRQRGKLEPIALS